MRAPLLQDFLDIGQGRGGPDRRGPGRPNDEALDLLLARARGQARAEGFAEGVEQTEARIARDLEARLEAVAEAIELARAEREAHERAAVETACAVARVFLGAVAPRLAALELAPAVIEALESAFRAAPASRPVIEVPAAQREAIEAALGSALGPRAEGAEIVAAPDLGESEARLRWNGGFDLIDTAGAASRALAVLDAHLAAKKAAPHEETEE